MLSILTYDGYIVSTPEGGESFMTKTILGLFEDRADVEKTISTLQSEGYNPKDISIVMKDKGEAEAIGDDTGADVAGGALSGATTGAVIGGIAGLLAGTVLPGLGAFLIGGPIGAAFGLTGAVASTVSGAATGVVAGGLIGALMGLGVSQEDATHYESRVKEGAILVAVPADAAQEDHVREILDQNHASDVRTVAQTQEGVESTQIRHEFADRNDSDYEDSHESHPSQQYAMGAKGGAASSTRVNPIQVQKYLKGIDYPCSKNDLLKSAEHEGADKHIIDTLRAIPDQDYNSPNDVSEAIGKIE